MKHAYIFSLFGSVRSVLVAENETELVNKVKEALKIEAEAEPDGQLEVKIDFARMDEKMGEEIFFTSSYVNEGELLTHSDASLTKTNII